MHISPAEYRPVVTWPGSIFLWLVVLLGGVSLMDTSPAAEPAGPRRETWQKIDKALKEGKPKTAGELLAGVEQAAAAEQAWDEAARAIATRVLVTNADRPGDDPQRLVDLTAATAAAPAEARGVLTAIGANWTWGFFQANRWRFAQRTTQAAGRSDRDLAELASWDLRQIVTEIRERFAAALAAEAGLKQLPVGDWDMLIEPGTMGPAYRPTLWDVVVHDCIVFATTGERGLDEPEDAFELEASSPALGEPARFRDWKLTAAGSPATDTDSPLLAAISLYQQLLAFHADDNDRTAFLAADLDRLLWAGSAAVADAESQPKEALQAALRGFIERAGDHELAALARFHLASSLREDDPAEARAVALVAIETHPASVGGKQCRNLVAQIEAKELSLSAERAWAAPWPDVSISYRNLARVHLRLAKADWEERLAAGKPSGSWLDDEDRKAILALPAVKTFAADLPATTDYRQATHQLSVAATFDAAELAPGAYWLLASHREDFSSRDNVVVATLVWVSQLAIVTVTDHPRQQARHTGYVVDTASGAPLAGATVAVWQRRRQDRPPAFTKAGTATTDAEGRYSLAGEQGVQAVLVATADVAGKRQTMLSEPLNLWRHNQTLRTQRSIVLLTDRGIYRPGQLVQFKGVLLERAADGRSAKAIDRAAVDVVLRDANGRELAKLSLTTNRFGSCHGTFPIPTGALPGRWSVQAQGSNAAGSTAIRVEEYKRPKFKVELAAPTESVQLGREVSLTGTATSYTGLAVAGAKVGWRVERQIRFPIWCRWAFPWLPFDSRSRRIARGTATTDADGSFTVTFPAVPDRSVPEESLPVFTFAIIADVTDTGGETRSADRRVSAGFTDLEAGLEAADWQAVSADQPAAVPLTISTTSLDGEPRGATGQLRVNRLVQPEEVSRGSLRGRPVPYPTPVLRQGGGAAQPDRPEPDPAKPETWADGEEVFAAEETTDAATGKAVATVTLPAGIYRATFTVPGTAGRPAVKATRLIEVVDPAATTSAIKRAFVLRTKADTVAVGGDLLALAGTGYDRGRMLIELVKDGKLLKRFWTEPDRTQTPISLKVTDAHRGGVTVRAWMVRDGRLYQASQTVEVPWTNKQLAIEWQRFTRKLEPATQEVWRATVKTVADPLAGPAAPALAEMVATLYDQSLDALAPHAWPGGFLGLFAREASHQQLGFTNTEQPLRQILGSWDRHYQSVSISYHRLRAPFGSPLQGGFGGILGGAMARRDRMMPMASMAAPVAELAADAAGEGLVAGNMLRKGAADRALADAEEKQSGGPAETDAAAADTAAAAPPPRRNLAETAFFLPSLVADDSGTVTLEFTLPDTLTTWQFKALAHDEQLRSGTLFDSCVAAKDLMVEPLAPRFLRVGDVVQFPVKVSNRSTGRLTGRVQLVLFDARSGDTRSGLIDGPAEQAFDLEAGASVSVFFPVTVSDGTDVLRYLATGTTTGSARPLSDGEEALLPVLPRKVLVTETIPVTVRGGETRQVSLDKLAAAAANPAIENQSLVVQAVSNPAWYAVLALPYLMEQPDESIDSLFHRLYANAYARHLVASDLRIAQVFEQWRGTDALESPLEKNTELVQTLLAETPWVREATDEREARARIALLFDATRVENEVAAAIARLGSLRNPDGGWPWFPGGRSCDSVTLSVVAGFGRLRANGVAIDVAPAIAAVPWIDQRLIEEKEWAERRAARARQAGNEALAAEPVLTPLGVFALYARSFFLADVPLEGPAAAAHAWCVKVGRQSWTELSHNRSQGQLAIALVRNRERETASSIIESLRQRAVGGPRGEQTADRGEANWQGMWWRQRHPAWWSWLAAPIETQSLLIEAFDEVAGDAASVEAMKAWLVQQKRTSRWPGGRATADAVGVLLGRGRDLLGDASQLAVTVGGEPIKPGEAGASEPEAGTGFFETRFVRREIEPAMAAVSFSKPAGGGLAFGGVHWEYLDSIENVEAAGREELAIKKELFVKTFTKAGPVLEPVTADRPVAVGDELVVRLVVTSDRAYEFLELADHRPSLTEPVDVLSGWKWADGVGWYQVTRDASTQLFFERLPEGTHVFEYSLRVAHRGRASSGFATIRSRYAPEFSARSASLPLATE